MQKKKCTITSRLNLLCGRFTTGAGQFTVCLMHTANADMHTAKHTRQPGISKAGLYRVQDIGHTTKLCRVQILTHGKKSRRQERWRGAGFAVCTADVAHDKVWILAVCRGNSTRQRPNLCRVPSLRRVLCSLAHGKGWRLPCARSSPCAGSEGTRQRTCLPCANLLPCASSEGTKQRTCLPCARDCAHGKGLGTREITGFR